MYNVRNFVVSDLHGQGQIYNSIIDILEKEQRKNPNEKIVLYINGDIIDRGSHSIPMLLDVMDRVKGRKGNIDVKMLAGNHELIMLEAIREKNNGEWNNASTWFLGSNGGQLSSKQFDALPISRQQEIIEFLENLPLNQVFDKPILGDRGVVVAHASAVDTKGQKTLKDIIGNRRLSNVLWVRKSEGYNFAPVGRANYLSMIGHTPTGSGKIEYEQEDNVLYVDCGCARLAFNPNSEILVPVVELNYKGNCLNVLHFDKNGDLVYTGTMKRNRNGSLDNSVVPVQSNILSKAKDVISKGIGSIMSGVESAVNSRNAEKRQQRPVVRRVSEVDNNPKREAPVVRRVSEVDNAPKKIKKIEEEATVKRVENNNKPVSKTVSEDNSSFSINCSIPNKNFGIPSIENRGELNLNLSEVSDLKNNKVSSNIILPSSNGIIIPNSTIYIPSSTDIVNVANIDNGIDIVDMYANFIRDGRSSNVGNLYINSQSGLLIPRYDNSKYVISGKDPANNMMSNIMLSSRDYKTIMTCGGDVERTFLKKYGYTITRN